MEGNQETSEVQHIIVGRAWILDSAAQKVGSDKIVV